MEELDRNLLRLCDVPREAAAIRWMGRYQLPADLDVEAHMRAFGERGLVVQDEVTRRWSRTEAGDAALRALDWELEVVEALPGHAARGTLRRGTVYPDDWFVVDGRGEQGRVLTVGGSNPLTLHTDRELRAGDVLRSHEPLDA